MDDYIICSDIVISFITETCSNVNILITLIGINIYVIELIIPIMILKFGITIHISPDLTKINYRTVISKNFGDQYNTYKVRHTRMSCDEHIMVSTVT